MGPGWEALVKLWWKLEESTGFDVGKGKGFTTTNRPDQMKVWIGRGRTGVAPELMVNSFSKSWWKWWKTINPDWRLPDGRDGELVQQGSGSWKSLTLPGQNGLLGPIACLKWWHERLETDKQRAEWKRALGDVTWVLRGMTA
ncbi:hypothetical protein FB45DRAFT_759203 [Roridomyces roridus]|uniref:Uncharacterized protein n=1 Tax=Roridomyces roridus TaxID=1738132 RepID=A0AAD7FDC1_9AGAR|nr:hypothetical protein FB45DRAFT_759203 [Roridomyces roridus]